MTIMAIMQSLLQPNQNSGGFRYTNMPSQSDAGGLSDMLRSQLILKMFSGSSDNTLLETLLPLASGITAPQAAPIPINAIPMAGAPGLSSAELDDQGGASPNLNALAARQGHGPPGTAETRGFGGHTGGISGLLSRLFGGSYIDENGNSIRGGHITWPAGFGPNKGISAFGFTDENGDYHTNLHWDRNAGTYVVGAHRVYTSNARMTPDGDVVYVDDQGKPGAAPQDSPDVIAKRAAERAQERYPSSWQDGIGVGRRFIPSRREDQ